MSNLPYLPYSNPSRKKLEPDPETEERNRDLKASQGVRARWDKQYKDGKTFMHLMAENKKVSDGFFEGAKLSPPFREALESRWVVEVGCGTGDFSAPLWELGKPDILAVTDFSREAVRFAQKRFQHLNFWVYDLLRDPPFKRFNLAVAQNVLQCLPDFGDALDRLLALAEKVIVIVPDKNTLKRFEPHKVLDAFTFDGHLAVLFTA